MERQEGVSPDRVASLSEEDVLPAGTEAKEGSLLIADKGALVVSPSISAFTGTVDFPPPCDEPGLHSSCCQISRSLRAQTQA